MTATVKRVALTIGAGIVAIGVSAGAYVHAQDQNTNRAPFHGRGNGPGEPARRGPGGPLGMLPMLGRHLNLTQSQQDQIKTIAATHKDEWQALADRGRAAHLALGDAISADSVNEALIRQKSAEAAAVEADMAVARAHAHSEVLQILTAEQKTQLKTMQAEMRKRMSGAHDARRGSRAGLLDHFGL